MGKSPYYNLKTEKQAPWQWWKDRMFDQGHTFSSQANISALAVFISDTHIFWELDPRKTRDLKEQPSANLWQAQLLLALMAACSPHLITRQVFRDEGYSVTSLRLW